MHALEVHEQFNIFRVSAHSVPVSQWEIVVQMITINAPKREDNE
jgi:hypothetical protein